MSPSYRQCLRAYHSGKFEKCLSLCNSILTGSTTPNRSEILYLKLHSETRIDFVDDLLDLENVHLPDEQVVSQNSINISF